MGLKLRFALNVHGYEYLRTKTHYPLPAYRTLTRKVESIQLEFGMFTDFYEPLCAKASCLDENDRLCMISFDEMAIQKQLSHVKHKAKMYGHVTLGDNKLLGSKMLLVLVRGLKGHLKQIIGAHITENAIPTHRLKEFLLEAIKFVEDAGLRVVALGSDMGPQNKALWTHLKICAEKQGKRQNSCNLNGHEVFIQPDVAHLLKNLKTSFLKHGIQMSESFVEESQMEAEDGMEFVMAHGNHVRDLWNAEVEAKKEVHSLNHLRPEDLFPDQFEKMDVGAAVRFFSLKTAAALELAVKLDALPNSALVTASFIRLVQSWWSLCSSKYRKTSITLRNQEQKILFLLHFIDVVHNMRIGGEDVWKPLNFGLIVATLSVIDISRILFASNMEFLLGHRLSQDATENVFSQVRRKAGSMPTASQCLSVLKGICVSQFISKIEHSSYMSDTDSFFLKFVGNKARETVQQLPQAVRMLQHKDTTQELPQNDELLVTVAGTNASDLPDNLEEQFWNELEDQNLYDMNLVLYIAGACTKEALKNCCEGCTNFLKQEFSDCPKEFRHYLTFLNKGGLITPNADTFNLIYNCEFYFKKFQLFLLRNSYESLIEKICRDIDLSFSSCCNIKYKLVKHYFTIRAYAVCKYSVNSSKRKYEYGTASSKRRCT